MGQSIRLTGPEYIAGILHGDRAVLARAVTLIESDLTADVELASEVLGAILPHTGKARRIGITGVPGAGKSTLIDRLGVHVIRTYGEKVAVLTVDPSSPVSRGSILGDKTRMENLAAEPKAFIRPSPARGHLGGVARRTREAMLLCEAAGYENVLIETVGVGQSETAVRSMTDFFLLTLIAGAGDELQGIKRGILEMADVIAVNKADGDNVARAERTRIEYKNALHLFAPTEDGWVPRVVTTSCLTGSGIAELWNLILEHQAQLEASGNVGRRRERQLLAWLHEGIASGFEDFLCGDPAMSRLVSEAEHSVKTGTMVPSAAARRIALALQAKEE